MRRIDPLFFCLIIINSFFNAESNAAINSLKIKQDSIQVVDSTVIQQNLEEITIAAFRTLYNQSNIPAPVNYISGKQLETGISLTPVEALNRVPGIIMHHGTINTNRLSIRGIGSRTPYSTNKIKAYFGEIPLTSGDGETTLEDIETSALRKVEIIKGPSSSLYGAGLGGVLLFYPKVFSNSFIKHQSTISSFNTFKNSTSVNLKQKNTAMFVMYSNLQSDGFRANNKTNRHNFLFNTQISRHKNISGSILFKLTKMKAFIPSSLNLETFTNSPQSAATNWNSIKGYEDYLTGQIGASIKINTDNAYYYTFALFGQFRTADELRPFNKLEESSHFGGSRGSLRKKFTFNEWKFNLITGFELFRENYFWKTISNSEGANTLSDNSEKRNYENLFFQAEFNQNDQLIFSAGLNYNSTRYIYTDSYLLNGDQSGKYRYDPVFSQRYGFNYKLNSNWSWFGNLSHGFSPPTLQETLLPEGNINPDIKPEQGWNIESGIRGSFKNRLSLELSYYRIYVSNLLVARRTGEDAYVGLNAGQSLHPGLEAAFKWIISKPGIYPSWEVSGNTTISNYHFTDFIDNGTDYSGKNLPGTAKTTYFISTAFVPVKSLRLTLSNRYMGKMAANDANTIYSEDYALTNFDIQHSGNFRNTGINIKIGVNNLFNIRYASMLAINAPSFGGKPARYYYPGNPRTYFCTVSIDMKN